MSIFPRARPSVRAAAALLSLGVGWAAGPAFPADLPRYEPRIVHERRAGPWLDPIDPGPASSSGYYGYFGYDLTGVPYGGLYSEPSTCLFSRPTPEGYRTVDACRY